MFKLYLLVPIAPLIGCLIAGFFGKKIGPKGAHTITILGVLISFIAAVSIFLDVKSGHTFNGPVYTWMESGNFTFEIGFMIDMLSASMMLIVTFVSLMVHIYSIGYMKGDAGYQRFFSYISLFTFSMLMLVMSNNFMQLFFGWEAVGLVSYLLIGFYHNRDSAIFANLKAFLVNRLGDFGFILGIGLVACYAESLDYTQVFSMAGELSTQYVTITGWPVITAICLCLFVGAMAKSAQVPLHIWLPDSMEGPTPISALIHAATMVTAGIFMVSRMSPLYELSETALSFILVIGGTTALFMGLLGIIQNDIKRVVAYSTISQLGYMTVALGASAYSAAVFHLMTHAFFKALLFLGAGSIIIGLHHDQDMRNMGGLRKYMPITWITFLIGALALIGFPLFSGFYSKDAIIEAVHTSHLWGASYASFCVTAGVFVTAFYTFRQYFLVFHGKERFGQDQHNVDADGHHIGLKPGQKPHESPLAVTLPLILLAIPSLIMGYLYIDPILVGNYFSDKVLFVLPSHMGVKEIMEHFHGAMAMTIEGLMSLPFWLAICGVVAAWYCYLVNPALPAAIKQRCGLINRILENKYYLDWFNENIVAAGARGIGSLLWKLGDKGIIDGFIVHGAARLVGVVSAVSRRLQTGFLYQYAFTMVIGVFAFLSYFLFIMPK